MRAIPAKDARVVQHLPTSSPPVLVVVPVLAPWGYGICPACCWLLFLSRLNVPCATSPAKSIASQFVQFDEAAFIVKACEVDGLTTINMKMWKQKRCL